LELAHTQVCSGVADDRSSRSNVTAVAFSGTRWVSLFFVLCGNRPPLVLKIDVTPSHAHDLATALDGQQSQSQPGSDGGRLLLDRNPEGLDLVPREYSIARLLGARLRNQGGGVGLHPFGLDREVQHLPHERQRPVRHDGRGTGRDRVHQVAHLASLQVAKGCVLPVGE
jgi:hypothetical protein